MTINPFDELKVLQRLYQLKYNTSIYKNYFKHEFPNKYDEIWKLVNNKRLLFPKNDHESTIYPTRNKTDKIRQALVNVN